MALLQNLVNSFENFDKLKEFMKTYGVDVVEEDNLYLLWCSAENSEKYENYGDTPETFNWMRECNGTIFEKDTNKLICRVQEHMYKRPLDYFNSKDFTFERLIDGTYLRVFYYKFTWVISTCRRIYANKNNWNSKETYSELLSECAGFNWTKLDPENQYHYIMCHPNSRLVSRHKMPVAYLVHTTGMPPEESIFPETLEWPADLDCMQFSERISNEFKEIVPRGFLARHNETGRVYCYEFPIFVILRDVIRNNCPNIYQRFIELLKLNNHQYLDLLYQIWNEYADDFNVIQQRLQMLASTIMTEYYWIYVVPRMNRKYAGTEELFVKYLVNPGHRQTLRQLDAIFRKKKNPNITKITPQVIYKHLLEKVPPHILLNLL